MPGSALPPPATPSAPSGYQAGLSQAQVNAMIAANAKAGGSPNYVPVAPGGPNTSLINGIPQATSGYVGTPFTIPSGIATFVVPGTQTTDYNATRQAVMSMYGYDPLGQLSPSPSAQPGQANYAMSQAYFAKNPDAAFTSLVNQYNQQHANILGGMGAGAGIIGQTNYQPPQTYNTLSAAGIAAMLSGIGGAINPITGFVAQAEGYAGPLATMSTLGVIIPFTAATAAAGIINWGMNTVAKLETPSFLTQDQIAAAPSYTTPPPGTTLTNYVPYGSYAQIQLPGTKDIYEAGGQLDIYQQTRGGLWDLVSSGSANALQSGMFTINAAETPVVYTQQGAARGQFAPGTNTTLAQQILGNESAYSKLGSEVYGGFVSPLTGATVQSTGAQLSTYANVNNLANLVSPTAVNLPKGEIPDISAPWSIPANSPALQLLGPTGLSTTPIPGQTSPLAPSPSGINLSQGTYYTLPAAPTTAQLSSLSGGGGFGANAAGIPGFTAGTTTLGSGIITPIAGTTQPAPSLGTLVPSSFDLWAMNAPLIGGTTFAAGLITINDALLGGRSYLQSNTVQLPSSSTSTPLPSSSQTFNLPSGGTETVTTSGLLTTTNTAKQTTVTQTPIPSEWSAIDKALSSYVTPILQPTGILNPFTPDAGLTSGKNPYVDFFVSSKGTFGIGTNYANAYLSGAAQNLAAKPLTAGFNYLLGAGIAFVTGGLSELGAGAVEATGGAEGTGALNLAARGTNWFVNTAAPWILSGLYATSVAGRSTNWGTDFSPAAASRFGGISSTETGPMIAGGLTYAYRGAIYEGLQSGAGIIRSGAGSVGDYLSTPQGGWREEAVFSAGGVKPASPQGAQTPEELIDNINQNAASKGYSLNQVMEAWKLANVPAGYGTPRAFTVPEPSGFLYAKGSEAGGLPELSGFLGNSIGSQVAETGLGGGSLGYPKIGDVGLSDYSPITNLEKMSESTNPTFQIFGVNDPEPLAAASAKSFKQVGDYGKVTWDIESPGAAGKLPTTRSPRGTIHWSTPDNADTSSLTGGGYNQELPGSGGRGRISYGAGDQVSVLDTISKSSNEIQLPGGISSLERVVQYESPTAYLNPARRATVPLEEANEIIYQGDIPGVTRPAIPADVSSGAPLALGVGSIQNQQSNTFQTQATFSVAALATATAITGSSILESSLASLNDVIQNQQQSLFTNQAVQTQQVSVQQGINALQVPVSQVDQSVWQFTTPISSIIQQQAQSQQITQTLINQMVNPTITTTVTPTFTFTPFVPFLPGGGMTDFPNKRRWGQFREVLLGINYNSVNVRSGMGAYIPRFSKSLGKSSRKNAGLGGLFMSASKAAKGSRMPKAQVQKGGGMNYADMARSIIGKQRRKK